MVYVSIVNLGVYKSDHSLLLRKIYLCTASTSVIEAPAEAFGRAIMAITIIAIRPSKPKAISVMAVIYLISYIKNKKYIR